MVTRPPWRDGHPYHMHDCIHDQPSAIAQILESQGLAADELAARASRARRIHLCGIGTSWHAALVGEHLFRAVGLAETRAWNAFEFASYPPPLMGEDLVIVMAHSGAKRYPAQALSLAKRAGASTAIVTESDLTSEPGAGRRRSKDNIQRQVGCIHRQPYRRDDGAGAYGFSPARRQGGRP